MAEKFITIKEAYEKVIETGNPNNIAAKTKSYNAIIDSGFKPTDSVKALTTDKSVKLLLDKKFVTGWYQGIRQIINAGGGKKINPFEELEVRKTANLAGQSSVRPTSKTYTPNLRGYLKSINEVVIDLTKKGDPRSLSLKNYIIMQTTAGLRGEQLIQGVQKHAYDIESGTFRNVITKGSKQGVPILANYELGDVHRQIMNQQVDLAKKNGWVNKLWHVNTNTMNDQVSKILTKQFEKNGVKWIYSATGESKAFSVGDLRNQTARIFYTFSNEDKLGRFMSHAAKTIGEKFYAGTGLSKAELQTLNIDTTKMASSLADDLDNSYRIIYGDLLGHNITDNAKLHGLNLSGTPIGNTVVVPEKAIQGKVDQLSGKNIALDIQLDEIDNKLDKTLANIEAKEQAIAEKTSPADSTIKKVESKGKTRIKNILKGKGKIAVIGGTGLLTGMHFVTDPAQATGEELAYGAGRLGVRALGLTGGPATLAGVLTAEAFAAKEAGAGSQGGAFEREMFRIANIEGPDEEGIYDLDKASALTEFGEIETQAELERGTHPRIEEERKLRDEQLNEQMFNALGGL